MSLPFRCSLAAVILFAIASTASAQERGDAGIVMGYPAAIGVTFHLTDTIAIRPEFSFTRTSTESSVLGTERTVDSWSTGVGASALFYVSRADSLRTYLSPRFSYGRSRSDSGVNLPIDGASTTNKTYSVAGSFGAQYSLSDRFSAFGEVGLAVSNSKTRIGTLAGESSGTSWGTRSGVGVVVYF
jgi:Outer membrane protein beta-barrel domain